MGHMRCDLGHVTCHTGHGVGGKHFLKISGPLLNELIDE